MEEFVLAIGDIIVGIDIGTSKVNATVGEVNNFNQIEVIANSECKCFGVKKDSEWSNHLTSISYFDRYKEIGIGLSREQTISIDISSWKGRMQIAFGTYFTSSGNDVSTNILKIWLE